MKSALSYPRPYLINRAGGLVQVDSFRLAGGTVQIRAISDAPVKGAFHLVYRCAEHENFDVKCAVLCEGGTWSLIEPQPPCSDAEICYP